jgi:hypothetical protein
MSVNCGHRWACCSSPTWYKYGEAWWNDIDKGNQRTWRKTCPSATTNPTWTDLGVNSTVRSQHLTVWAMAQSSSALSVLVVPGLIWKEWLDQWSATGVPLHGIVWRRFLLETVFKYKHVDCIKFIMCHIKLNQKYLFAPICVFHVYVVGYEVYHHPPFLQIDLRSTGCKCKLTNFN